MSNLHPFFDMAVQELNRHQTATLGDRNTYIGASDVAGCARKVYLQKQNPVQPNTTTLLKFSRGHAAEWLLDRIFTAGGGVYDTQVELVHPSEPMKAHLDFLFYTDFDGNPELHAIEVKSVSGIPDAPYPQWEDQLSFQLGLLRMQYPEGKISGSILAMDLNAGQVHQFNGYGYDEPTFNYLYCRGLHLLDVLNGRDEPRPSPSILCAYCGHRDGCPAFASPPIDLPVEVEMLAQKYAELNGVKTQADKELKSIRQELVDYTGPRFKGHSDRCDLTVSYVEPSMTVDGTLLKKHFPDVYPQVLKAKAGYTRLEVRTIRQREQLPAAA